MNAIQWTVAQSRRLDLPCDAGKALLQPSAPARPDPVERAAAWVIDSGRRVTWVDLSEHLGVGRYRAMALLREGARRDLLRRIVSSHRARPDLFEGCR